MYCCVEFARITAGVMWLAQDAAPTNSDPIVVGVSVTPAGAPVDWVNFAVLVCEVRVAAPVMTRTSRPDHVPPLVVPVTVIAEPVAVVQPIAIDRSGECASTETRVVHVPPRESENEKPVADPTWLVHIATISAPAGGVNDAVVCEAPEPGAIPGGELASTAIATTTPPSHPAPRKTHQ
jgi:hypothetical protein